jgi:hypothetical protein
MFIRKLMLCTRGLVEKKEYVIARSLEGDVAICQFTAEVKLTDCPIGIPVVTTLYRFAGSLAMTNPGFFNKPKVKYESHIKILDIYRVIINV